MSENRKDGVNLPGGVELQDEDIYEAMKSIPGYLDITPGDFKEVYQLAYRHALERLSRAVTAQEIMTREVVTVQPDMTISQLVHDYFLHYTYGGFPVLADGRVVGELLEPTADSVLEQMKRLDG